jgi:hypothetical protein
MPGSEKHASRGGLRHGSRTCGEAASGSQTGGFPLRAHMVACRRTSLKDSPAGSRPSGDRRGGDRHHRRPVPASRRRGVPRVTMGQHLPDRGQAAVHPRHIAPCPRRDAGVRRVGGDGPSPAGSRPSDAHRREHIPRAHVATPGGRPPGASPAGSRPPPSPRARVATPGGCVRGTRRQPSPAGPRPSG